MGLTFCYVGGAVLDDDAAGVGLGKSGKREKENGDTCVFVDAVLSSAVFFGVAAPGWGGREGALIKVRARGVAFVATLSRGPSL